MRLFEHGGNPRQLINNYSSIQSKTRLVHRNTIGYLGLLAVHNLYTPLSFSYENCASSGCSQGRVSLRSTLAKIRWILRRAILCPPQNDKTCLFLYLIKGNNLFYNYVLIKYLPLSPFSV